MGGPVVDRRTLLGAAFGLAALGVLPGLAACGASSGPAPGPTDVPTELTYEASRIALRTADVPDLAAVVAGLTAFGADLHRASAAGQATWTVSPLSIAVAFGMLRAGAAGATARQLDGVFGWAEPPHPAFNVLTADLVTTDPVERGATPPAEGKAPAPPIVAVANALFLDRSFAPAVRQEFLRILAEQYGAKATALSFADASAAATINAWVHGQTRGRIDKLFDALDPSTAAVLANAVYLKAAWASPFEPGMTADGKFRTPSGSVTAPLMSQVVQATYDEADGVQRLAVPYVGGELSMHLVLPRDVRDGAGLTALVPKAAGAVRKVERVALTLPRWDTATDLPLLPVLGALGLTDLADLSGIAPDLRVSDAIHRANVTVDEAGTEAAAVTGIAMETSAPVDPPVEFRVDRPFVWAVVHEPTRTPVFLGHVVDPS